MNKPCMFLMFSFKIYGVTESVILGKYLYLKLYYNWIFSCISGRDETSIHPSTGGQWL